MSAARPPEGAQLPLGGTSPKGEGGTICAARPPEGAQLPPGGTSPQGEGGAIRAARPLPMHSAVQEAA